MNTMNNVQITVTKIINAPGQGILAAGHIEDGLVHVGDFLQVHNHHPGATARVGRISIGSKVVKEARSGSDAMLLLERIEEAEIHPGDRLLPGQETELRKTDEESWEKLPERIEPILHLRQLAGKIGLLVFLSLFWVIGGFILLAIVNSNEPIYLLFVFFILWFGFVGYMTYNAARALINGLHGRSRFLNGQSQTVAQILRRKAQLHEGKYSDYYTFHLQMEFTPTLSASAVTMRLEASISEKLYERLWGQTSVTITYAVEDPRIFVLNDE